MRKHVCNVHTFRLSSHFACHRWWLGTNGGFFCLLPRVLSDFLKQEALHKKARKCWASSPFFLFLSLSRTKLKPFAKKKLYDAIKSNINGLSLSSPLPTLLSLLSTSTATFFPLESEIGSKRRRRRRRKRRRRRQKGRRKFATFSLRLSPPFFPILGREVTWEMGP